MSDHVDLVKNEWHAGRQKLVARAFPLDGDIKVEVVVGTGRWELLLRQPILTDDGRKLYPRDEPVEFLRYLHETIIGSDFFATDLHSEQDCPFHGERVVPLRTMAGRGNRRGKNPAIPFHAG